MYSEAEFTARWIAAFRELADGDVELSFRLASGHTGKPRASSLGDCARKQLYACTGVPHTDSGDPPWAATMGYAGEALCRETLRHMGYTVTHVDIPDDLPFSGHIDDVLEGLDLDCLTLWDNKVRGTYGMRQLITRGLPAADPTMYLQMQAYMYALGLTQCMITVQPHDLSLMKREVSSYMKGYGGSPLIHRIVIQADREAQEIALVRSTELQAAINLDTMVRREYNNAKTAFPCGWCDWHAQCIVDDSIADQLELTSMPDYAEEINLEGNA